MLVTDFKKITLYGDCYIKAENFYSYKFRGRAIKVKILGLFWVTYKKYLVL